MRELHLVYRIDRPVYLGRYILPQELDMYVYSSQQGQITS